MSQEVSYSEWGRRLRAARLSRGWSQGDLAREASSSVAHVSNIEVGRTSVSDALRVRLSAALGIPVADLFPYPEPERVDV